MRMLWGIWSFGLRRVAPNKREKHFVVNTPTSRVTILNLPDPPSWLASHSKF